MLEERTCKPSPGKAAIQLVTISENNHQKICPHPSSGEEAQGPAQRKWQDPG